MDRVNSRILIDKEREFIDGNLYFRLYLWEEDTGQIIQVLSPVNANVKKIIRNGVFNELQRNK
jgi:hypothetical protein